MSTRIVAGLPHVSVHFSRFRVVEISLKEQMLAQFDEDVIMQAVERLAEARVDVIAWNGTSSGWLGLERDETLCRRIKAATGIPATTSMLALNEVFAASGVRNYGLITPYTDDVQARILSTYEGLGYRCASEVHFRLQENFSFAEVGDATILDAARQVALHKPDAIAVICTNLRAAHLAEPLEQEYGIPVYDTVSTAVWGSLRIAGIPTNLVTGWGSLFQKPWLNQTRKAI
ncbi:maleate cis-trans isomerase family protein [Acidocella aminolytica]